MCGCRAPALERIHDAVRDRALYYKSTSRSKNFCCPGRSLQLQYMTLSMAYCTLPDTSSRVAHCNLPKPSSVDAKGSHQVSASRTKHVLPARKSMQQPVCTPASTKAYLNPSVRSCSVRLQVPNRAPKPLLRAILLLLLTRGPFPLSWGCCRSP